MPVERFRFGPRLVLEVNAGPVIRRYFRAEYGRCATSDPDAEPGVVLRFGSARPPDRHGQAVLLQGGHKLSRWRVRIRDEDQAGQICAALQVRGPFGLPLVQSYFVEPLLSIAAVRAGSVQLPGAAIEIGGQALLLLGGSGSGKSSLSARALAAGRPVLGDDQVLISPDGRCSSFPRRLRLYPDLARTAPAPWARLAPWVRGAMKALGVASDVTRGALAPPVLVRPTALGSTTDEAVPLTRVALVERSAAARPSAEPVAIDAVIDSAAALLDRQRAALRPPTTTGNSSIEDWAALLERTLDSERALLASAIGTAKASRYRVPRRWTAATAVGWMAAQLELEP